MAFQLTVTYCDHYQEEEEFFIPNDCELLDLKIKTNDFSTKVIFPNDFRRVIHDLSNPDNTIILDEDNFLAYLLPSKKLTFNGKAVETLVFSYLLEWEKKIASTLPKLPN